MCIIACHHTLCRVMLKNAVHEEELVSHHLKFLLHTIRARDKKHSEQDLSVSLVDLQQKKKVTEKQLTAVHDLSLLLTILGNSFLS